MHVKMCVCTTAITANTNWMDKKSKTLSIVGRIKCWQIQKNGIDVLFLDVNTIQDNIGNYITPKQRRTSKVKWPLCDNIDTSDAESQSHNGEWLVMGERIWILENHLLINKFITILYYTVNFIVSTEEFSVGDLLDAKSDQAHSVWLK